MIQLENLSWGTTAMACVAMDSEKDTAGKTNLKIKIPTEVFDPSTTIELEIYNHENLDEKGKSEAHTILASEMKGEWVVKTEHLSSGKDYRLSINGLSSDGCNKAFANFSGSLKNAVIELDDLPWATTKKACTK